MSSLNKAISLRESGKLEEARSMCLHLIEQEPDNPSVWYHCGWVHDVMELEKEAIPYYKRALDIGLMGEEKLGAFLGLGSTYRVLGMYNESKKIFEKAIQEYPNQRELQVFYSMALYNLNENSKAMEILLNLLAETSSDPGIQSYKKAILFYSNKLNRLWN